MTFVAAFQSNPFALQPLFQAKPTTWFPSGDIPQAPLRSASQLNPKLPSS